MLEQTLSRRWLRKGLWTTAVFLATAAVFGCWRARQPTIGAPARPIALLVSGDTGGWIVPCGCTSNQSGGLPRRGTYVRELRRRADVCLVDVGGAPGGSSLYQKAKFEAILRGEHAMGLVAHNVGAAEAAMGAEYLMHLGKDPRTPFVSANARNAKGQLIAQSLRIIDCGGRRLGITGVLSSRYGGPGIQVSEPREALLETVLPARQRYDELVVLAYLPEDELRVLANSLPEASAVIGGPTGQTISPQPAGATLLAAATNKGKFLVELEMSPSTKKWSGKVVEMGPQIADDPEQSDNVHRYLEDLGRRDFAASETGLAINIPGPPPPEYRLAGDEVCLSCHANDCRTWKGTRHAHAWLTLVTRGSQVDPGCQQCHTTAYGLPGGFESIARTPLAVAVRCESCHGPSLLHARRPRSHTPFAASDQCIRCHDRENSPKFEYAQYWRQIWHGNATATLPPKR
jgi:hypothetical protein